MSDPMGHKPMTRQRSPWVVQPAGAFAHLVPGAVIAKRNVADGLLLVIVGEEPGGWHLSISHHRITGSGPVCVRYPTWDEIVHARDEFLPADRGFVMHLPVASEFVALHDTTFHLHEAPE